ncbi:MAG: DNA recombination protein RmuC [Candidatus Gastranaerophilales bacterium]|nr:DNA recombination protein RmuC [Candidatus Gastranaerophilales bacterium]
MELFFVGILIGFVASYILINFTTVKSLRTQLLEEISSKEPLKEELYQLKALSSQNEQNEKNLVNLFENIAAKILKENTVEFAQTNQKELDSMLKPFKENLNDFGQKMEDVKKQNTELKTHIEILKNSSETLSKDAQNLTEALRGNSKIQGNWGEVILKRILEASGLEEGFGYTMQDCFTVDNNRYFTDCIVRLPEDKNIIIDSKVSLIPLQNYYQARDEQQRSQSLKELERSVKNHIDELDKKAYYNIPDVNSADYVLMFMPVESGFTVLMAEFDGLLEYAWKRRILLVSPSSLMVALRTVEMFWKQEKQTKNIQEIVRVGGNLYDKFAGVVEELNNMAAGIKKTQDGWTKAMSRIQGHGGIASQAERLKELGAKTQKQISKDLIEVEE